MSRSFQGNPQVNYAGNYYTAPAQTLQSANLGRQKQLPPQMIPLTINWSAAPYNASTNNPNVNVFANLAALGPNQGIDRILSCRIDNLGNPTPVYVQFPDTGYTICAPANTVVWEPVETNQLTALIAGLGFSTGSIGPTQLFFCNFFTEPAVYNELNQSVELWKASPVISRGTNIYNTNFGAPALGDQTVEFSVPITATPGVLQSNLFGTPYTSGFLYLTFQNVYIENCSTAGQATWVLESTGAAGILFVYSGSPATTDHFLQFLTMGAQMSVKLDATQTWRLRSTSSSAVFNIAHNFNFSVSQL